MLLLLSAAYLLESPDMVSVILASSVFFSCLTIHFPHPLLFISLIPLQSLLFVTNDNAWQVLQVSVSSKCLPTGTDASNDLI